MGLGHAPRMLDDIARTPQLGQRIIGDFRNRGLSSAFKSHVLHVLSALRRAQLLPDYLLCVDTSFKLAANLSELAQVWIFQARSQTERMQDCLQRVLARERKLKVTYAFFMRLRPIFLVLMDFPDPRSFGFTNEHLSSCCCEKHCCSTKFLDGDF